MKLKITPSDDGLIIETLDQTTSDVERNDKLELVDSRLNETLLFDGRNYHALSFESRLDEVVSMAKHFVILKGILEKSGAGMPATFTCGETLRFEKELTRRLARE